MNGKVKIAFYSLGCKLNFTEAATIASEINKKKYEVVDYKENADIYVINTCTVTSKADKKSKMAIRSLYRKNPEAKIIVCGCFSELNKEETSKIEGVYKTFGVNDRSALIGFLNDYQCNDSLNVSGDEFFYAYSIEQRTRSFCKIQDGCDYFCAYCTIPYARGRSRSAKIDDIIEQVQRIIAAGQKEIVLTGVNIGDFGKNNKERLIDLLKRIEEINSFIRIRLSSIEPDLLNDELIQWVAKTKTVMPHFHIPLQSGSNQILKLMKRRYSTELVQEKIERIRGLMPFAFIALDVIVGFPNESEEDFQHTLQYIKGLDISQLHVFAYADRRHAQSYKIHPKTPSVIKKQRSAQLLQLSEEKLISFYRKNIGQKENVLFEARKQNGKIVGLTENYLKVLCNNDANINKIIRVKLKNLLQEPVFII